MDDNSVGSVGTPLYGVDVKLVSWQEGGYAIDDITGPKGEIHVGGEHLAAGYYNMPDKTEEDFYTDEDGKRWFKTGDIGQVMTNGSLTIIDRKKDLVKLQMGEYVSLGKVESILKIHRLVDNVCVYARSSESFTVAIVVVDEAKLRAFTSEFINMDNEISIEELCHSKNVIEEVLEDLSYHALVMGLEKFEIPKQIYLTGELWTPDSGMVTAAMKLKRKAIEDRYETQIDRMHALMKKSHEIKISGNSNKVFPA